MKKGSLRDAVVDNVEQYFEDMHGEEPSNLHRLFLTQVEKPFIEVVLQRCASNQSKAAEMLGINRNTLRSKIKSYKIKI